MRMMCRGEGLAVQDARKFLSESGSLRLIRAIDANTNSLSRDKSGQDSSYIMPPDHTNTGNFRSLQKLSTIPPGFFSFLRASTLSLPSMLIAHTAIQREGSHLFFWHR